MRTNIYVIVLMTVSFFMFSCKEEKKSDTTQMEKVRAIHDEVMTEMGTIGSLIGQLSEFENDSTVIGKEYKEVRIGLQDAHRSMMDWMKGFSDRFDPDEILNGKELTEQKQKWLDEEELKVIALKTQINESIEKAQKLMGNH